MISLRYHIVSIAAVFLALAVGVVLGSTAISSQLLSGLSSDKDSLGRQVNDLQTQQNSLNAKLADADRFALSVGSLAVRGALDGKSVVLITAPGFSSADRDALAGLIRGAGGTVNGELQLTDAFTDPARADQLRGLVTRLLPAGVQLPTASDPGTLAAGLIGPLTLLDRSGKQQGTNDEITAAMSGLVSGGFVRQGQGLHTAQLAIVLTGGAVTGDSAADRSAVIARFATQLQRSGGGAVLAGQAGSADGSNPVAVVRADSAANSVLSTVDNVQSPAGQVATILALKEQAAGHAGSYGTAGNAQAPTPGVANG